MWQVEDKERWDRAHGSSRVATCRVELWADGRLLTDSAPIDDGSVTDDWAITGVRRSLSLTVAPTRKWLAWLDNDGLEVRPFLGNRFSRSLTMECPMGRFPLTPPEISRPLGPIQIHANDYYQWIDDADFQDKPVPRPAGYVTDAISWLVRGAGLPTPLNLSTSTEKSGRVTLDQTRLQAVEDAAKSISGEVYVDRLGQVVIADARELDDPTSEILTTNAVGLSIKPDPMQVYNVVSVKSGAEGMQDVPARVARIDWEGHPAHPYRLGTPGRPRIRVLHYSSDLLTSVAQMDRAASTLLARKSAAARTTVYEAFPDPSRDAGDSIVGATITGAEVTQIASVTHPLRLSDGATQQVTTVSTQLLNNNFLYIFGDVLGA